MDNYNIRNSITEGKSLVFRKFFENFFSSHSHRIIVMDYIKSWLDSIQKFNSQTVISTVPEKGNGFYYNIPCCVKRDRVVFTVFKKFTGFCKIRIMRA